MNSKYNKKSIITQNIWLCEYGILKNLPVTKTVKNNFNNNLLLQEGNNFCDVIVNNISAITIARELILNKMNPIILNLVTEEFTGSNMTNPNGIIDDTLYLITNYYKSNINSGHYPLNNTEITLTPNVIVFRNENYSFLNSKEYFKIDIITASPIYEPKLEEKDGIKYYNFDDYLSTKELIENIFQTAYQTNHDALILNDLGCNHFKHPIGDLVDIINLCILKYGSLLKYVFFSIPIKHESDLAIFAYFSKQIIKPQDLVKRDVIENEE